MSSYARNSKVTAYQGVSVHSGVAGADPHRLILMLMDGALERLSIARGCLERSCRQRGDIARKAAALQQSMNIFAELHGSLNLSEGGTLANNLGDLYDYMIRQLLRANTNNETAPVVEVAHLMEEIRSAWIAIGPEVRKISAPAAQPAQVSAMAGSAYTA